MTKREISSSVHEQFLSKVETLTATGEESNNVGRENQQETSNGKPDKNKPRGFYLPDGLYTLIKFYAAEKDVSNSDILREGMEHYFSMALKDMPISDALQVAISHYFSKQ